MRILSGDIDSVSDNKDPIARESRIFNRLKKTRNDRVKAARQMMYDLTHQNISRSFFVRLPDSQDNCSFIM